MPAIWSMENISILQTSSARECCTEKFSILDACSTTPKSTCPAQAINGVSVVHDGDFVGVAAPDFFRAGQAIDALAKTAEWKVIPRISTPKLYDTLSLTALNVPVNPYGEDLKRDHQVLRQTYNIAYVQHAPMEPRAAVAEWQDGKITVWTGTQNPFAVRI